jgi:hypothetical protein
MTQNRRDADGLSGFFAVIEELCRDGNQLVREFVQDEVCEVLNDHPSGGATRSMPISDPKW